MNDIKLTSIIIHKTGQISVEMAPKPPINTPVHIKPFQTSIISLIYQTP